MDDIQGKLPNLSKIPFRDCQSLEGYDEFIDEVERRALEGRTSISGYNGAGGTLGGPPVVDVELPEG